MKKITILFIFCCIYFHTTAQQTKLTNQLEQLLVYAKDGFNAIRGEQTNSEEEFDGIATKLVNTYTSSFKLEGSSNSSIIETYPNKKTMKYPSFEFKSVLAEKLSKADGESLYDRLANELRNGFTNGFTIKEQQEDESSGYHKVLTLTSNKRGETNLITMYLFYTKAIGGEIYPERADVEITVR